MSKKIAKNYGDWYNREKKVNPEGLKKKIHEKYKTHRFKDYRKWNSLVSRAKKACIKLTITKDQYIKLLEKKTLSLL